MEPTKTKKKKKPLLNKADNLITTELHVTKDVDDNDDLESFLADDSTTATRKHDPDYEHV